MIARFQKLCLDSTEPSRIGPFWAAILHREWQPNGVGEGGVLGPSPQHTLWFHRVPDPKTVKHRVHLDIYTESLAALEALGSTVVLPGSDDRRWTVMADLEGGEYCAFLRDEPLAERLHGLVVDSVDPASQAAWWAEVYGGDLVGDQDGFSTVEHVPGMPILTLDFVPVPEPKTVPNRIRWDVTAERIQPLLDAGAKVLQPAGPDRDWTVLADPEGNEFRAFPL